MLVRKAVVMVCSQLIVVRWPADTEKNRMDEVDDDILRLARVAVFLYEKMCQVVVYIQTVSFF